MTLTERWRAALDDEAVSPVIAVILMVAITVVLAATVYVWVSGFATEDTGPEQASATANGVDLDDNGDVEWIQLTLTKGENAPYGEDDLTLSAVDQDGNGLGDNHLCVSAQNNATATGECDVHDTSGVDERFFDSSPNEEDNTWDVGQTLWIPCQEDDNNAGESGNHQVTVSLSGTTILDQTVSCDEPA